MSVSNNHWDASAEDEELALALALSASLGPSTSGSQAAAPGSAQQRPKHASRGSQVPPPHGPGHQQQQQNLYEGFDVCPGCGSRITLFGQHIMALGRKWHLEVRTGQARMPFAVSMRYLK